VTERLRREIGAVLAPPWGGTVERAVFGRADIDRIVAAVDRACVELFGLRLRDGFFYRVSVGCVFGCVLDGGRRVVLKAYQPRWTQRFLEAMRRVQRHLHATGVACPEPIGRVLSVDGVTFVAEAELPDPGIGALTLRVSAHGLADVVERCRRLEEPDLVAHPLHQRGGDLYPEPHSPIFDFVATAAGAEWIDRIARQAREIAAIDTSAPVIAHSDWSARNLRMRNDELVAVYDWDSLVLIAESEAVGLAAATWSKTGEPGDGTPSAEDIERYVAAYDEVSALTPAQQRSARAAAVWAMAYTARCEHAIDPNETIWTTTRPRLREVAPELLA
jgi:hypothetical protein